MPACRPLLRSTLNRLRLHLALTLLRGLPENVWIGRYRGPYPRFVRWQAGRLDDRDTLQPVPLHRVFDCKGIRPR